MSLKAELARLLKREQALARRAAYRAPQRVPTPRQAAFLDFPGLEALYGGAAGGGKSDALLMAALQHVTVPGYSALLLRRTYADLALPGALMDRAHSWLAGSGARWNGQEHKWTFPSGASLQFGYLDTDKDRFRYQSSEFQFIGFDELTQFSDVPYRYLFSRLRRLAGSTVPLRMRSASNPGNVGHEWVKARFTPHLPEAPAGRLFVPARLDDNPHVDRPAYEQALAELDPITRQQLRDGDWNAVAGGRFRPEWFSRRWRMQGPYLYRIVAARSGDPLELKNLVRFGTADPAASVKTSADWTVISAWAITPQLELVWLDCVRGRWEVPDIIPQMQQVYDRWGLSYLAIEGGGTQQAVYQLARRTRMAVKEVTPEGKDKLTRATKAIVLAESGRIILPQAAPWVETALGELVRFTVDEKVDANDDIVDTAAYAGIILTRAEDSRNTGFAPTIQGGRR